MTCHERRPAGAPRRIAGALGAIACCFALPAAAAGLAPGRFTASIGWAHDVDFYDVGLMWELPTASDFLTRHDLSLHLSGSLAYWNGRDAHAPVSSLVDVSATPLLRWSPPPGGAPRLFAEAGIGVHLLSHTQINYKQFSTAFQFGERAALGLAFGPGERLEVAGYVQHVSNGGIKVPNDGITQGGVMLRVSLD